MTPEAAPKIAVGPARQRIDAIDACRGLALLGIFMVNIAFFSGPMGEVIVGEPPDAALGIGERAAWYITGIFFTGKFYPLFSMLFGAGLILQMERVEKAGGRFVPLYLRRLGFLLVVGLLHATLLWYGDILFIYGIAGLALLLMRRLGPRTMLIVAAGFFLFTMLLTAGATALSAGSKEADQPPAAEVSQESSLAGSEAGNGAQPGEESESKPVSAPAAETEAEADPKTASESPTGAGGNDTADDKAKRPLFRMFDVMQSGNFEGPIDRAWVEAERDAYRNGGFWAAMLMRGMTWLGMLVFCLFGFGWHVPMMFLIGAALLKMGFFTAEKIHWHKRFVWLGVLVGLPIAVFSACTSTIFGSGFVREFVAVGGMYIGGPLLALAYIGVITLLVHRGSLRPVTGALARVGRMALTNYLMQTVAATFIFYWWGLGLFGEVSGAACVGIVVGIYLVQVAFSAVWMRFFLYGPMEWLWRSVTYLRVQPLLRGTGDGRAEA
ncbi:MAG: DUF418 domain-containing protein [Phycisphaerales bacterium]|nr:DUF418 domain-containing protein [Phycisphaerales bacterium]